MLRPPLPSPPLPTPPLTEKSSGETTLIQGFGERPTHALQSNHALPHAFWPKGSVLGRFWQGQWESGQI